MSKFCLEWICPLLLLISFTISSVESSKLNFVDKDQITYRAAVVEYNPIISGNLNVTKTEAVSIMNANLDVYQVNQLISRLELS